MCEVAILDPRRYSIDELTEASMELYSAMGSSLGIVLISENGDQTEFEYDIFKEVSPSPDSVGSFYDEHSDGAIRAIIHGRLATHGSETLENAHPLEIDCPECDIDYIVHNGVVTKHRQYKSRHVSNGHDYNTVVDTEAIAHEYGDVPEDFQSEPHFQIEPCYILIKDERVYIYATGRYHLSERGEMARSYRTFGPERTEDDYLRVILTPTNAE